MYELDIEKEFSAAHSLKGYKGDCSLLHGHNWTVQAFVAAEELDDIGIAVDFKKLKADLEEILSEFDHKNLSDLEYFSSSNPTSERLARLIYDKLSDKINDGRVRVTKVRVCESRASGASYYK